ncbi:DUF6415 family natural product biosynthesis protein [Streptomyces sp. NBC_01232]|uniref:DUF6415 family natural product biosynthesis protein n=1 Tax=Streptomyces sp. NBC_01232 TaxID=2903786 RepID=UPI002E112293|nr:DUF6415 family natural product biosynthesis protein [Streptomyces sp. NBC_01232]
MQTGSDTGSALVARALVPYNQKPDERAIALLVDDLLRHGDSLLVHVAGRQEAAAALGDWHRLTAEGPTDSPVGNWNHARALARTVRSFRRVLAER